MTKTVRILSILAAIIVVILVVLPTVFSSQVDEETEKFIGSPSILDKYKNVKSNKSDDSEPPLVTQAKKFALYLDPPKPTVRSKPKKTVSRPTAPKVRPQKKVTAKFDLEGTSYFAEKPELSMALINEPGEGLRWIRQSSKIGHLTIKEVLDGKIIIQDGSRTYDMQPKRQPKRSLVKEEGPSVSSINESPSTVTTRTPRTKSLERSMQSTSRTRRLSNRRITRKPPKPVQPEISPEKLDQMNNLMNEIEGIDNPDEIERRLESFLNNFNQIDATEAENLEELGRELSESEPNK